MDLAPQDDDRWKSEFDRSSSSAHAVCHRCGALTKYEGVFARRHLEWHERIGG